MREIAFEVPLDTSAFTPLQLQPRFVVSVGFSAWSRWIRRYLVPFPALIRDHQFGVVVVGVHVEYTEPFRFFDTDSGEVRARVRARLDGTVLETEFAGFAAGKNVVNGVAVLLAVKIDDIDSLGASPAPLSDELLARLEPDEIDSRAPTHPVRRLLRQIEREGRQLAEGAHPFTVYRHACEVADQWCVAQIPCYVSEAREAMGLARGEDVPQLRRTLSEPLRCLDMELRRPMYIFDRGTILTRAYDVHGRLAFVHRVLSSDEVRLPSEQLHGVVIECF